MTPADEDLLDYEALVEEYNASLSAVLRHHQSASRLDAWVPDESAFKSLLNMVEAAEVMGRRSLAVRIGPATRAGLNLDALVEQITPLGRACIEPAGPAIILRVTEIGGAEATTVPRSADPFDDVAPAYRDAVRAAAGTIAHEGGVDEHSGTTIHEAMVGDTTLALAVDASDRIVAASHRGQRGRAERAVLDVLCRLLPGLTVQEARDHGSVRLEHALRDPKAPSPVTGIVLPKNADPLFNEPGRLLRALTERYAAATGYAPGWNYFTTRPAQRWLGLDDEGRRSALAPLVAAAALECGLREDDVRIARIERVIRVTVAFHEDVSAAAHGPLLLALERRAHRELDPTIQIFSIELKDANVLRRL
jgi:hypothetical protein